MDFVAVVDQVIALLRQRGRVAYRTLKRQFDLDDAALADLKIERIDSQRLAADEQGTVLVWTGAAAPPVAPADSLETAGGQPPLAYTPLYLAEKILTSRTALEGERKQVTVLFADLKGSTELIAGLDPEAARQLLAPAIHCMMTAVHRDEGTVNQVLGDGIMALFGAPIAHEDHAVRACYAALAMQEALQRYAEEVRRTQGLLVQMRVGLNSGEVVVRVIGNDLHMDYSAVGQTTHLAARMEQLAAPGSILLTAATLRLVEGLVRVQGLGPVPVKGLAEPVEVFELIGVTALRRRLQAAVARGLSPFVGRQPELEALQQALARAGSGQGQIVALLGKVWQKALAYGRQAGDKAQMRSANREAVGCFEGALAALQHLPDGPGRYTQAIDLRFDLGMALLPLGAFARIFALLQEAIALAEAGHDQQRLGRIYNSLITQFLNTGDPARAIDAGQRALPLATRLDDVPLQIYTRFTLARVYGEYDGDYRQAADICGDIVATLTGDALPQAEATLARMV